MWRWGPHVSAEKRGRRYRFGMEGSWAMGWIWPRAKICPRGLFFFSSSFTFIFSGFLLIFWFENFYKTSDLNLGQTLKFVKLSLCY
jgi:hypothetical protein